MKNKILITALIIVFFILVSLVLGNKKKYIIEYSDMLINAEVKELQKEINDLKNTLELNNVSSEFEYINATVISRNYNYWFSSLMIDKGMLNKVYDGYPVLINSGLIGMTYSCNLISCKVRLLTNDNVNNKISIKIVNGDNYYYGLLVDYDIERNKYLIEGVTEIKEVKEGLMVTTTGLTDYFPSGLLIGSVSSIKKDDYDLSAIIEVTPSVDFNDINIVSVLKRKIY